MARPGAVRPGGLPEVSRGLSAAIPPERGMTCIRTLEGCQEATRAAAVVSSLLAPLPGCACLFDIRSGGSLRSTPGYLPSSLRYDSAP